MARQVLNSANADQIRALQTLCSQWQKHTLEAGDDPRATRLAWASQNTGRNISSFSDLTRDEARLLIDLLKGSLGQPIGEQPQPWRRINSRERAQAAGTSGRREETVPFIQMASPDDLARVEELVRRLAWTQEQFTAWLKSPRSPLGSTDQAVIRTAAQANRIYWALKAMLIRAGGWHRSASKKPVHAQSRAGQPTKMRASQAQGSF
jgi:hypothetical protein